LFVRNPPRALRGSFSLWGGFQTKTPQEEDPLASQTHNPEEEGPSEEQPPNLIDFRSCSSGEVFFLRIFGLKPTQQKKTPGGGGLYKSIFPKTRFTGTI